MKHYTIQINRGGELKWLSICADSTIHAIRNLSMALAKDAIPFDIVSIAEQYEIETLERERAASHDSSRFSPGEKPRSFEIVP